MVWSTMKFGEQDGEDDVEEVETWTHPVVEGEQLAADAQGVVGIDLSEWPSKEN